LFDARRERVIILWFYGLSAWFWDEFPLHGFRVLVRSGEAVVFRHVVGFPRDFFFVLLIFLQNVGFHAYSRRGELFGSPCGFKRREWPARFVRSNEEERERERENTCIKKKKERKKKRSKGKRNARAPQDPKQRHRVRSSRQRLARLWVRVQKSILHARLAHVPITEEKERERK